MSKIYYEEGALQYIAKVADGHLRDAVSLMDKCLAYNTELTLGNVVSALGTVDYDVMIQLTDTIVNKEVSRVMKIVEELHNEGKDLKQFIRQYMQFLLDVNKYAVGCDWKYISVPKLDEYQKWLDGLDDNDLDTVWRLLDVVVRLNSNIKYSQSPKYDIEADLMLFTGGND